MRDDKFYYRKKKGAPPYVFLYLRRHNLSSIVSPVVLGQKMTKPGHLNTKLNFSGYVQKYP